MTAVPNTDRAQKVVSVEELAGLVADYKARGLKVALAHGVFDLLHLGHIRYLQQARAFADVLVVTITPDEYVNKGPHRPAFTGTHRAEAIAALDCVQHAAINKWPSAVELLELVRPDFYVKGSDYRDAQQDLTGGIAREEAAVRSVGGQLVFTDDITFSSSALINRHLPVFPEDVMDFLTSFSARYSGADIMGYLDRARPLKVLVIGETIIDEYQYCEAIGKSSKEPMLAVKSLNIEKFAGGILAVANHVASFVDKVGMITFLGEENPQQEFIEEKLSPQVESTFLYRQASPTIVKRRVVENYFFTKLLQIYEFNDDMLGEEDDAKLCDTLRRIVPEYDVVVVVDFGHGMLTEAAIEVISEKARFLALNVQSNAGNHGFHTLSTYPRADYISVAEREMRLEARDRKGDLRKMMLAVSERLHCPNIIVTRGKAGSLCYSATEGFFDVPALATQVVDRVGAGDAVLCVTSLAVAMGASPEVVPFIGNVVGAEAVTILGNQRSIERIPMYRHVECLLKVHKSEKPEPTRYKMAG
jgi:rfaE bifunctional protein kinase chain/domain/rfaE bifunctional protein nucleotidyltransferase chain/domain